MKSTPLHNWRVFPHRMEIHSHHTLLLCKIECGGTLGVVSHDDIGHQVWSHWIWSGAPWVKISWSDISPRIKCYLFWVFWGVSISLLMLVPPFLSPHIFGSTISPPCWYLGEILDSPTVPTRGIQPMILGDFNSTSPYPLGLGGLVPKIDWEANELP